MMYLLYAHSILESCKKFLYIVQNFSGLSDFIILIISISVVGIDFLSAVLSVFNLFNSFISIRKFCY